MYSEYQLSGPGFCFWLHWAVWCSCGTALHYFSTDLGVRRGPRWVEVSKCCSIWKKEDPCYHRPPCLTSVPGKISFVPLCKEDTKVMREKRPEWWKASRARLRRRSWGHLFCSVCRGLRKTSLGSVGLSWGQWNRAADLLLQVTTSTTWRKGMKLPQGKFRLDIRKIFFTERVVRHWNKLSYPGSWHQGCWRPSGDWTMLLAIWFSFRQLCWTQSSWWVPANWRYSVILV